MLIFKYIVDNELVEMGKYFGTDGRGVTVDLSSLDKNGLINMILNDVQRELLGEGQVFFMFKRLNRQVLRYSGTGSSAKKTPILPTEENFVLPLPDSESNIK